MTSTGRHPNSSDACPNDPTECFDADMDGICDNADPDDDNDDIPDECDIDSTGGVDCNDNGVDDIANPTAMATVWRMNVTSAPAVARLKSSSRLTPPAP